MVKNFSTKSISKPSDNKSSVTIKKLEGVPLKKKLTTKKTKLTKKEKLKLFFIKEKKKFEIIGWTEDTKSYKKNISMNDLDIIIDSLKDSKYYNNANFLRNFFLFNSILSIFLTIFAIFLFWRLPKPNQAYLWITITLEGLILFLLLALYYILNSWYKKVRKESFTKILSNLFEKKFKEKKLKFEINNNNGNSIIIFYHIFCYNIEDINNFNRIRDLNGLKDGNEYYNDYNCDNCDNEYGNCDNDYNYCNYEKFGKFWDFNKNKKNFYNFDENKDKMIKADKGSELDDLPSVEKIKIKFTEKFDLCREDSEDNRFLDNRGQDSDDQDFNYIPTRLKYGDIESNEDGLNLERQSESDEEISSEGSKGSKKNI